MLGLRVSIREKLSQGATAKATDTMVDENAYRRPCLPPNLGTRQLGLLRIHGRDGATVEKILDELLKLGIERTPPAWVAGFPIRWRSSAN